MTAFRHHELPLWVESSPSQSTTTGQNPTLQFTNPTHPRPMNLKTTAISLLLLGQAFFLCPVSAVCLDPKTLVSGYKLPLASEIPTADAIVIGRVLSEQGLQEDPEDPDGYTAYNVKVKVIRRLKGSLPSVIVVRNENTSSRYPMSVGEDHLLFISHDGQELRVNSCGNSSAMPGAKQLVKRIQAQLRAHVVTQ